MFRRQEDQEIEFSGFCLNEPFKGKTIEGTINLAVADSLQLTKGANFNNRSSGLSYNYREQDRNSSRYQGHRWSNSERRREDSTGNQVLTVLFSLIFFITFVANHLIDFSHESSATLVLPNTQSQVEN